MKRGFTKGHENQRDKNVPPILNLGMDRRGFLTPPEGFSGETINNQKGCLETTNNAGSVLIWIIVTITVSAVLASAVLYLTTGSTLGELFANYQMRAYYLAESGGNYAIPQIKTDHAAAATNLHGKTFTMSNGDKFSLSIDDTNSSYTLLESTGIINEGGYAESRRKITYKINKSYSEPFTSSTDLNNNWNINAGGASILSGGPADGEPALNLTGKEALISLKWDGNPDLPDLAVQWTNSDGLLSYDLQAKIKVESEGGKGDHFMLGLSFRLDTNDTSGTSDDRFYGISFFHSIGRGDAHKPAWVNNLNSNFDTIMDGDVYIILWRKINSSSSYILMDYKKLTEADGVVEDDKLEEWSTIVVSVQERYQTDGNGNYVLDGFGNRIRENLITGYVQGKDAYPRNTVNWNFSNFNLVVWGWKIPGQSVIAPQTIIDGTLTSVNFDTRRPEEIGIHGYYDSTAANDQFFDDFSSRIAPGGGSGGSGGIQY
ncbi:MAG: hypothetical protein HZA08_14445 [Nitrospirae bacterium]|nr:hypothetical protein [Nitrospirota bacterium]